MLGTFIYTVAKWMGDQVDVVEKFYGYLAPYGRDQEGGVTGQGFLLQRSTSLSIKSPIFRGPSARRRSASWCPKSSRSGCSC